MLALFNIYQKQLPSSIDEKRIWQQLQHSKLTQDEQVSMMLISDRVLMLPDYDNIARLWFQ